MLVDADGAAPCKLLPLPDGQALGARGTMGHHATAAWQPTSKRAAQDDGVLIAQRHTALLLAPCWTRVSERTTAPHQPASERAAAEASSGPEASPVTMAVRAAINRCSSCARRTHLPPSRSLAGRMLQLSRDACAIVLGVGGARACRVFAGARAHRLLALGPFGVRAKEGFARAAGRTLHRSVAASTEPLDCSGFYLVLVRSGAAGWPRDDFVVLFAGPPWRAGCGAA